MAVAFTWRHTSRREVEIALYVALRMVHLPGRSLLAVLCEPDGHTWCCVELAAAASEADARDWSQLLERRYRVDVTADELLATPWRFSEVYLNAGVGALLNDVERQQVERDRLMREARG